MKKLFFIANFFLVDEKYRKQGIGAELAQNAIAVIKNSPVNYFFLLV